MIRHIALFSWAESTTADDAAAFSADLATMPDNVPGILRYEHGPNAGLSSNTVDYGLVADFASVADYEAYSAHPYHLEFIAERVRPLVSAITRIQYEIG